MDRYYNLVSYAKKALDGFLDRSFVDENGNPIQTDNLTDPAAAAKKALTIEDTDNLDAVAIKLIVALLGTDYLPELIGSAFYGIPKSDYKQSKTGLKKQIIFYFEEPRYMQAERKAKHPKRLRVGVNVEGLNFEIPELQEKIKRAFPDPKSEDSLYFCGTKKHSYFAPEDGVQITQLPANTGTEAKQLIEKILGIFGKSFKTDRLKESKQVLVEDEVITGFVALRKVVLIDGTDEDLLIWRPYFAIE